MLVRARVEETSLVRFDVRGQALAHFSADIKKPSSLAPTTVPLSLRWVGKAPAPVDEPLQVPLYLATGDGAPRDGFDIEPENRTRVWEPLWVLASSPRPAHLEVETTLLMLDGRARKRVLSLRNSGETPLVLRPPLWPVGMEVEARTPGAGEWTLAPGGRKEWTIHATGMAKAGIARVVFSGASGDQLGEVSLMVPAPGGLTTRTRYVLGVDFGTSGTSIWKRDGRDDRLEAVPLTDPHAVAGRDDPHRFPSVLYVSFRNGHEVGFFIGYEALRRRVEDLEPGLFVTELKTLLRAEGEPYVAKFGPNYRVDLLLKRYLETLRRQIILPDLEGGEAASVAWNFSLPVLDSHRGGTQTLYNLQRSRLEKAIRAAHFVGPNDTLEFFTEPFCAAIYLLLQHGHYRYPQFDPPHDGDWACIFDSGGGTTDVVLGQVRLDGARMRFEEVATLGGYQNGGAAPGKPAVSTFGGEALTRTTAIYLSIWQNGAGVPYDFLRYFIKDEGTYKRLNSIAQLAPKNEEILLQGEVELAGNARIPNPWVREFDVWNKTEAFKRQFAGAGSPGTPVELEFKSTVAGVESKQVKIARREFDEVVVNRRLDAIGAEMRRRIFPDGAGVPAPVEIKWVFGVGGNCRVRRVQDWLQEFFPGGVQELTVRNGDVFDDSDRMLAVAGGAVWAGKASQDNTLPYALRVVDERGKAIFEADEHAPLASVRSRELTYDLHTDQSVRFTVFVRGAAGNTPFEGRVGMFALRNVDAGVEEGGHDAPVRAVSVKMELQGRRLNVSSDQSGQLKLLFSYSF